ncbi:NRAMP (natural resistance-associated macrophage protein) metal ion transporters [Carnobacterium iners]|uniref:NRAMP (Natural resistance-associated macrophage protein) metal ion transporters n=1 Tax=Carnobacterium iners TaxID=1073423 RepID=A0A1X7NAV2_9LACT|nr:Nramp family divalent metal transporter [Carnobacterium iners]SEK52386.1 NRAMP (natural resistance-associated macrophage protein) metal ion transporters [Carnobacterium iners]SMH34735.1 NRAMP (natural resistance-associated macrophage protein) metal ion transporters [Carnobacterium iners]
MGKQTFSSKLKSMGPAAIIASAFIGPGTITTTTIAGANYGYQLLWAVLFSIIALMVLMEMSSRIGIISRKDAISAAEEMLPENKVWGIFIKTLALVAVLVTCFGFQSGNEIGASLGLGDALGLSNTISALIVGAIVMATALMGTTKILEKIMLLFVSVMGIIFVITMILVKPDISAMLKGLFVPTMPNGGIVTTMALIGTSLIAINLVLHSVTSKDKWKTPEGLVEARFDIKVNILIGGLITISMLTTSAALLYETGTEVTSPLVFSTQLEPILGNGARIIGDLGIFAAGLSSAIAIPFILKTILASIFNWEKGINDNKAKLMAAIVVIFGTAFAVADVKPTQIIIFAQATSGFFLPFFAALLLVVSNSKTIMGKYTNTLLQNILGLIAVVVTLIIGMIGLYGTVSNLFS